MNEPIAISYAALLQADVSVLYDALLEAFGSNDKALGLLIVSDLVRSVNRPRPGFLDAFAALRVQDTTRTLLDQRLRVCHVGG